jgi:tRNA 2-thiouridine synthesizing protein A
MTRKPKDSDCEDVDARGLSCPEPVLMLRAALRAAPAGARVRLRATDPLAGVDVKAYCLRNGHALVAERERGGEWEFVIERG